MIGGLCESPLTFEAIIVWREELNEGRVLLREIIDLDATYGGGPSAQVDHTQPKPEKTEEEIEAEKAAAIKKEQDAKNLAEGGTAQDVSTQDP